MKKTSFVLLSSTLLAVALADCKKEEPPPTEQATPAATPAAKPAAEAPKPREPSSPGEAAAQAAAALAKLTKAADEAQGGHVQGKVVNWRKLAPFVPEKLGDLAPAGDLDGSTGGMGAMQLSTVKRRYKAGDKNASLEIADATLVPMMRAGFTVAAAIDEDSTSGVKKGIKLQGFPGIVEWRKSTKRGKVTVLVGGRYIVSVELSPTTDADAVLEHIKAMDLAKLAALKAD